VSLERRAIEFTVGRLAQAGCSPELKGRALAPISSVAAEHIFGWSVSLTTDEKALRAPRKLRILLRVRMNRP